MKLSQKVSHIRLLSTIVAIVLTLPLGWKGLTGLYSWLSPFITLNSVFLLKSVVWLNILGFLILIVAFFRKRWFCKYLCPMGFGCDVVSSLSRRKKTYLRKIPQIGRWLALLSIFAAITGVPLFILLDPMAIFNGFFGLFSNQISAAVFLSSMGLPVLLTIHLFLPGVWCAKICPLGGLFDEITRLKRVLTHPEKLSFHKTAEESGGRRIFIAGGAGLLAGFLIPKWIQTDKALFFRPPASVSGQIFNTLCIRCGNCIKSCPTQIIIQHTSVDNITTWMTPEVSFTSGGYCLENCNRCGNVCPTGAISPFTIEAKKELFIGSVKINLENCLLIKNTECDRCKAVCHYKAIDIVPSSQPLLMNPVVDKNKCVGCGACAAICPPETIEMITSELA